MFENRALTQAEQGILDEITNYHRSRIYHFGDLARSRQAKQAAKLPWSFARAVDQMLQERLSGSELEFFQETARLAGRPFDPQRIWVPFELFRRDLTASTAADGGHLVGIDYMVTRDILRPFSVTQQAGVTVEENLHGNVHAARTSSVTTITWMTDEAAEATPAQPTVSEAVLTPKTARGIIQCSRQFMKQANPEQFLRRELLKTTATIVDRAVLKGTGIGGEPLGILFTPGIETQSGTALAWPGVLSMKRKASDKNVQQGTTAFIAAPAVRELLEGRVKATGGGSFIWEDEKIASCPAYVTTDMPAATLLSGPMAEVLLGIWGNGIEVSVNPYGQTLFKAGIVQFGVTLSCDVAILCDVAAFTKSSSIT